MANSFSLLCGQRSRVGTKPIIPTNSQEKITQAPLLETFLRASSGKPGPAETMRQTCRIGDLFYSAFADTSSGQNNLEGNRCSLTT